MAKITKIAARAVLASKAALKAPAKAPAAKKAPAPVMLDVSKGVSKTMHIRRIIGERPDISLADLKAALAAGGLEINPATVTTIRADVHSTMQAFEAAGWKRPAK